MAGRKKVRPFVTPRRWHPLAAVLVGLALTILLGKAAAIARSAFFVDKSPSARAASVGDHDT